MRRPGLWAVLTLVLALLGGGVGSWVGARYFAQSPSAQRSLHAFVHEELALTPAQEQQVEALETEFAVRRRAREAELRAANAELAAAIQARHEFSPQVQAAVQRFHHAMGELQNETIVHVLSMRRVLTPAQAAKFDRRIAEALTEDTP
jgi:Spy/CpxP family protein refolding chaperone